MDKEKESSQKQQVYRYGADKFVKEFSADGQVFFYKNGKQLTLVEWNREINLKQPMANLADHSNPLIRYKENQRRDKFLKMVQLAPSDWAADVGSERGYFAVKIAPRCKRVFCIDIDANMLGMASQNIPFPNVSYVQSDVRRISLDDNCLDVVMAAEILEHIPDPAAGLAELVRIVRPNGRIYISVPNEPLVLFLKRSLSRLRLSGIYSRGLSEQLAIGHLHVFSKDYLSKICRGLVEVQRLHYNLPFFLNVFAVLRPLK